MTTMSPTTAREIGEALIDAAERAEIHAEDAPNLVIEYDDSLGAAYAIVDHDGESTGIAAVHRNGEA